jgi:hypothetical protein
MLWVGMRCTPRVKALDSVPNLRTLDLSFNRITVIDG